MSKIEELNYSWETLAYASAEDLPWSKQKEIDAAAKAAQMQIATVRSIVGDAKTRYVKKKVNARNKKQAEDMALRFADVAIYESEHDIQDAYGFGEFSEEEYDRLIDLFRLKQEMVNSSGQYSDPVVDLLNKVMDEVFESSGQYWLIEVADRMRQLSSERDAEIQRANNAAAYERYKKGV